ncbi:MAG: peptidylprolyl isomerase, partial [Burkholderia sp.]|nr:peptidylprolyl isomerase [Burkholderia sp.]
MNDVLSDAPVALRINGVAIGDEAIAAEAAHHGDAPDPLDAARRSLAVRELLRQRAVSLALLDEGAPLDDAAVDALLERELTHLPEPDRADCERYYAQHPARFRRNDIVYASHVLFAMTDRVPLAPLRQRAEQALA